MERASPANRAGSASRAEISRRLYGGSGQGLLLLDVGVISICV